MKKQSVLRDKSFEFGSQIIDLCKVLKESKTEYVLYNQLLRSGTAIGALIREAEFAQSRADFINKLSIALKEANESEYWLDLLTKHQHIKRIIHGTSIQLLTEIIKMLVASINTAKKPKEF